MLHKNIFRFTKPDLDTMQGYKKVKSKPYLKVELLTFFNKVIVWSWLMRQTSFLPAAHNSDKKRQHLFGIQFVSAKYQINLLQNVNSLPI